MTSKGFPPDNTITWVTVEGLMGAASPASQGRAGAEWECCREHVLFNGPDFGTFRVFEIKKEKLRAGSGCIPAPLHPSPTVASVRGPFLTLSSMGMHSVRSANTAHPALVRSSTHTLRPSLTCSRSYSRASS